MKVNKMISIEWDLIDKLKGLNASGLINELLITHFAKASDTNKLNSMSTEELEALLVVETKREELNKQLKEL
tara:strand:+ start:1222 stop:1437 length:216 start_codon:yes stop_codon:yes gene_type:complete